MRARARAPLHRRSITVADVRLYVRETGDPPLDRFSLLFISYYSFSLFILYSCSLSLSLPTFVPYSPLSLFGALPFVSFRLDSLHPPPSIHPLGQLAAVVGRVTDSRSVFRLSVSRIRCRPLSGRKLRLCLQGQEAFAGVCK